MDEWIKKSAINVYEHTLEYYSAIKRRGSCICHNTDRVWGHYATWNKSGRKRQMPYDIIHMWNLEKIKKKTKTELIENRLVVARGGVAGVELKWVEMVKKYNFQLWNK